MISGDTVKETLPPPATCVHPSGRFLCGIHRPSYRVINRRMTEAHRILGHDAEKTPIDNKANFPPAHLCVENGEWVYEIPNPFPFWGATYILSWPADNFSKGHDNFSFKPVREEGQDFPLLKKIFSGTLKTQDDHATYSVQDLPRYILLAVAQSCRDPEILKAIVPLACKLEYNSEGTPVGFAYDTNGQGKKRPVIHDHDLFETLGNNPALPEEYRLVMVLWPGAQGDNPILGEYRSEPRTHIWEYLRANSYIPWGHYASNMAQDSIRYKASDLSIEDIRGLRHLYYQRIYSQMALYLDIIDQETFQQERKLSPLDETGLESLRHKITERISQLLEKGEKLPFAATLWGWNYGYDFSSSGYRLHASHQQIHQQFALIRPEVETIAFREGMPGHIPSYAVGDQVADFCRRYKSTYKTDFFETYLKAIVSNERIDGKEGLPASLVLFEDEQVILHVPKAQRSQGEVQIMVKRNAGNILETDSSCRKSIDKALFLAIRTFDFLGAEMVTSYEVSKPFDNPDRDQRLFYCMLPRHPQSPGAFSERQERWITGHFPEDYAAMFRKAMSSACPEMAQK